VRRSKGKQERAHGPGRTPILSGAAAAAFAAGLYCYVWFRVDPALLYWRVAPRFPCFWTGWRFARTFLSRPGGPAEYAAAFLSQLYYYSWAGAAIITLVALLLCCAARELIRAVSGARPRLLHFVPALLVAASAGRYAHHLAFWLALLTAVSGACVYARAATAGRAKRMAAFLALSGATYYVAGGAYLAFAALCALSEFFRRRPGVGTFCLASAGAVPYGVGVRLLQLRARDALFVLLPYHPALERTASVVAVGLCAFYVVAVLASAAARRWRRPAAGRSRSQAALEAVLAAAVALPAVWWSFDSGRHNALRVQYYARHRDWAGILEAARRVPRRKYGPLVYLTVNWALYHEGRLSTDLLAHPQRRLALLRMPEEFIPSARGPYSGPSLLIYMRLSDIYLDLGRVNEAEHMATEAMEAQGYRPWILYRLALVNVVKARTAVARVYLNALRRDLLYGPLARRRLKELEEDPLLRRDPVVRRLRAVRPVGPGRGERSIEGLLTELLHRNPANRMAFEYLMAHYLLTGNLDGIVRNLGRWKDFGYESVPRYYQEAAAIYMASRGTAGAARGLVSEETLARLREFQQHLARPSPGGGRTPRTPSAPFRDSYFAYYHYLRRGGE